MKSMKKYVLLNAKRVSFFKSFHDNVLSKTCSDEIESIEINRNVLSKMCSDEVKSIEIS